MPTVGLLTNELKSAAREAALSLAQALQAQGVAVRTRPVISSTLAAPDADIAESDFVVVFGGDGTLLAAARLVAPHGKPILGIHLGHFGFMTEASVDDLIGVVQAVLEGRCEVQERMMLEGTVHRADGTTQPERLLGMNDIVVASKAVRMVHIRTQIGAQDLATYAADGVIVASPTGSTGYSLSAGGPLVHPAVPALLVTPIAPHTLAARALVIPASETIRLIVEGQTRDSVVVTADGQVDLPLNAGDVVQVSRAAHRVRLLSVGGPDFYQKIRSRWHYAQRLLP